MILSSGEAVIFEQQLRRRCGKSPLGAAQVGSIVEKFNKKVFKVEDQGCGDTAVGDVRTLVAVGSAKEQLSIACVGSSSFAAC